MPRIDPQQLLNCLSVLLATNGGIKSSKEVQRLVLLMGKFSKKLVSKCIYVQILKSTETELLGQFMAEGGWSLSHTWLQDGILTQNWPLVQELLELMLLCPVDVQRLKSNSAPKLVKGLSKEGGNEGVRILASKLVEQWLKIVKGETSTISVTAPRQDVVVAVLKPEMPDIKQEMLENADLLDEADEPDDMVDPLEIPVNHVPIEDKDTKERLAKAKSDGLVFKITVKDGKQVLAKVEASPKKEIDAEKVPKTKNEPVKAKHEPVAKVKSEPVNKAKTESTAKTKTETVENKKEVKEKVKKESIPIKEQDKQEQNKKIEKSKDSVKEKSKSEDKGGERRSSKENKEIRDSKDSSDGSESKDVKEKDKKKDSSSKSSSKHSSSRSSSHKSSSSRRSSDGKHKSSSSSSSSSNSRDKSKDSEKDKDKDRSTKSSSNSSKSSSKISSSSSSSNKPSQSKEKRDSTDDKVLQSTKDKDTLTKVIPPSISKLGKIPKKAATEDTATESVTTKKSSISIEVKKDSENRPKTVKTYNSQFRSHGLAEEAPPPPSRRGLQRPSSQPTAGASIPATLLTKRTSPPPEKKDVVVPEKKLKIDIAAADKPGIKLIPAKPKTPVLVESDMFMDAIFASRTTKKDSTRKRKRVPSLSTSETTKPEKVQSPDAKSLAPKFYQDTLDDSEAKDEDKSEETKIKDETVETIDNKETNNSKDVEMEATTDSNETKEAENVIVENKKPPGPGTGPNGPPGVLTILKRKGPKKQLRWKPQESLEEIHFFELDETERVNVSRSSVDMTQMAGFNEREGDAFLIARKMNADDLMAEQIPWKALILVDDVPPHPDGSSSKEKKIQSDRELTCLRAIYFTRSMIPENPAEPDMEQYQITDAAIIPLDDANGSPEGIKSFVNYPWPEPRGSPPHQSSGFEDQSFANFQPNFPYNNQPGWTPPNVIPPPFNGPPNLLNMNPIQPEPINNMNMNPMPPFQQNPNFCPPNGMRNNFGGNFGNNDGRMHHGPPQNNPGWFRPNGPMGQPNNWRPPMGNNNNRPRPDWNPRNVCRSFAKGFCRNGDKCQWLHPGINCPPF